MADLILVNGGLGPTVDDMSAQAMAAAKEEPLAEFPEWTVRLQEWFTARGRKMSESNLKQSYLPKSSVLIDNPVGTACGFRVKLNRAWLFFTPGVPIEFKHMVEFELLPFIKTEFEPPSHTELNKLLTFGFGESPMADQLNQLTPPTDITVGYRSSMPHVEIKSFARGAKAKAQLPAFTEEVKQTLGDAVVSDRAPSLAFEIHQLLSERGKTLSIAESCTGGMVAEQLVTFAGSSQYLKHGLVTYCNESKQRVLGVPSQVLEQEGAVSVATVLAMAEGTRNILSSDYGVATSGIAGPDGGTEAKPVGTVAIAVASAAGTWGQLVHIGLKDRTVIRKVTAALAYDMLRRVVLGQNPIVDYSYIRRQAESVPE